MPLDATAAKIVEVVRRQWSRYRARHHPAQRARRDKPGARRPAWSDRTRCTRSRTARCPDPAAQSRFGCTDPTATRRCPRVVWFHGGGWVLGSLDTEDHLCRLLCDDARVMCRLGRLPPRARDEIPRRRRRLPSAAWTWITAHAPELGIDPSRIAVGGDSAGGNLAAVVALVARQDQLPRARVPAPRVPGDRLRVRTSVDDRQRDRILPRSRRHALVLQPLRGLGRTTSPTGVCRRYGRRTSTDLPPAVVITAEYDPLRDQGEAYGERLQRRVWRPRSYAPTDCSTVSSACSTFLPTGRPAWDRAIGALRDGRSRPTGTS